MKTLVPGGKTFELHPYRNHHGYIHSASFPMNMPLSCFAPHRHYKTMFQKQTKIASVRFTFVELSVYVLIRCFEEKAYSCSYYFAWMRKCSLIYVYPSVKPTHVLALAAWLQRWRSCLVEQPLTNNCCVYYNRGVSASTILV